MKYKNVVGSSDRNSPNGSWKEYWISHSGREWPDRCSIFGCNNKAECGLHIRKVGEKKEYIVPGCRECNPRTDEFDLKTNVVRVDANTQTVKKS